MIVMKEETQSPWRCPLCKGALVRQSKQFYCQQGHSFDRAKEGYVNLLLANQKKSKVPGDTQSMVLARRRFLDLGFYSTLAEAVGSMINEGTWLDMGCGEGYFLRQLQAMHPSVKWLGIDVSRPAIKLAARNSTADFAVASNYDIPMPDQSIDGLIHILAPSQNSEVIRVLKSGGQMIRVSPGPTHLYQLREYIYTNVVPHQPPRSPDTFTLKDEQRITQNIILRDNETIQDLVRMTPYQWHGNSEGKETLMHLNQLHVTIDFLLQRFNK